MKTVSSVASVTAAALSVVGLALGRRDTPYQRPYALDRGDSEAEQHRRPLPACAAEESVSVRMGMSMTTTTLAATYQLNALPHAHARSPAPLSAPFAYAPAPPRRLASGSTHNARPRAASTSQLAPTRHRLPPPTAASSPGMHRTLRLEARDRECGGAAAATPAREGDRTPNTTWLRGRWSSHRSTSRDSGPTPSSRPGSAAVSCTNGSYAISQAAAAAPIGPGNSPLPQRAPLPPNKLVKRTSSLHSTNGFSPGPGSQIPVFRRPLTSHQRSATMNGAALGSDNSGRVETRPSTPATPDTRWRPYFTPRIAADQLHVSKRRRSTSIPYPIRRVYPDRKYTPTLLSTRDLHRRPEVELDEGSSEDEFDAIVAGSKVAASSPSPPFPPHVAHFEAAASSRRSFSIGDLLLSGPQPPWRRPSSSRGRPWSLRKAKPRVVSEPPVSMGSEISKWTGHDSERPAKRLDLGGPPPSRRSVISSSSSNAACEVELNLGNEAPYVQYTYDQHPSHSPSRSQTPDHFPLSSTTASSFAPNAARVSASHSELPSTLGSDSECRSVCDNSTDYQSESYYDSFPTRTTRSSAGRRGPHIETIFDESPPTFSSGHSTKLKDFLGDGNEHNGRYSTIEEEGSVASTPVRSLRNKSVTSTPSARPRAPHALASSPPAMGIIPDLDEIDWDADEDSKSDRGLGVQQHSPVPSFPGPASAFEMPFRFGPALRPGHSHSANSTPFPKRHSLMEKPSLFDWAEPQPSPSHPNHSPPRPRTVHGKKDQVSRGSRPAGRRPVSGMHARSHSVPVAPDLDGKRSTVVANKFGTWGVGSKAVTEDWNEDFDFDEPPTTDQQLEQDEKRIDSGHEMLVPRSIQEQQQNVVANIGLLREWGLLIEELKELRIRAVALNMLSGPYARAWREVDAMIELADQETDEQTLEPQRTPPSSPGFDMSAFEDTTPSRASVRSRRCSIAQSGADISAFNLSPAAMRANPASQSTPVATRPRKDSEVVAQSVIAALQAKRGAPDSATVPQTPASHKKVPFDTATLRHIVPYVNGLKRKVKDALRETEGLYSSPHRRKTPSTQNVQGSPCDNEPAFRSIFNSPQDDDITTRRQSRREQAATDNDGFDSPLMDQSAALANQLQRMTFT